MNTVTDINLLGLGIGLLLMLLPLFCLYKIRTGLVHSTLSAIIRMIVQLWLIGLYLQYLFIYNIWWVNLIWGVIMTLVATGTALQRTKLKPQVLGFPLFIAFFASALVIAAYFIGLVMTGGSFHSFESTGFASSLFSARYFIPIFGLLLGNMLGVNVLALSTYFDGIRREQQMYRYLLGNGATRWEASLPFLRNAIIKAFNPCIANMAVMGLVAMPGTMIGQILGGSDPSEAIKYQMMIVVITFVASMASLMITIWIAQTRCFDRMGRLKDVTSK